MDALKIGTGIIVGANLAIASALAQPPHKFGYGCGTGCSAKVKLVSSVKVHRYPRTKTRYSTGAFSVQMIGGMGGKNSTFLKYVLADCRNLRIIRLEKPAVFSDNGFRFSKGETADYWQQLSGDSRDYTTVMGGGGYYLDLLCKTSS